jgi:hypothetical protein
MQLWALESTMKIHAVVALMLLAVGCATTRVVNLNTGQGPPTVYHPVETRPVEISEAEFRRAVAQFVLDVKWDVMRELPVQSERLSLLASAGGVVDGVRGRTRTGTLIPETAAPFMRALFFSLDTVWEGVEEAVKDFANPAALRAMVVSTIGTALVMLVAPEPITKLVAVALTASLIAYLGTGPVWNLGRGFLRLMNESSNAQTPAELERIGHRFGKVLGDNGARVLVIVAMSVLGGKSAMSARGAKLPGATQAALRARSEGGFLLSAAWSGGVNSISLSSAGALNVALAPTAVAAVAMGPGITIQGDPEGDIHHICTDKNEVSESSGGPWTPLFDRHFRRANMNLNDPANLVRIKGHKGPHSREYHQAVLDRIEGEMYGCRNVAQCRAILVDELAKIAKDLTTAGTRLRKLITKNPEA